MANFFNSLLLYFIRVLHDETGALITKTYTFSAGATILASEHNTNFDTLYNWANGNVDNANIKASAGISLSKLSLGDDATFTGDFNFTNAATTDDIVTVTGSSLTTGSALKIYSNSNSTSTRSLVNITNDHADADDTVGLLIQQDGADYAIDCGATGKIRGEGTDIGWAGKTVQIVNTQTGAVATGTTAIPKDDSIPQKTEGDEYMTLAITPKSATNKLKIDVVVVGSVNGNAKPHGVALFQDDTAGALAGVQGRGSYNAEDSAVTSFTHYMTAGTTSETTFKVRAGGDGTAFTFNGYSGGTRLFGGVAASSITITEIQA
jgi:hypothetical protein